MSRIALPALPEFDVKVQHLLQPGHCQSIQSLLKHSSTYSLFMYI